MSPAAQSPLFGRPLGRFHPIGRVWAPNRPAMVHTLGMHLKAHRWAVFVAYAVSEDVAREAGTGSLPVNLAAAPISETPILCYDCGTAAPGIDPHCPDPPKPGYPFDSTPP